MEWMTATAGGAAHTLDLVGESLGQASKRRSSSMFQRATGIQFICRMKIVRFHHNDRPQLGIPTGASADGFHFTVANHVGRQMTRD